MHDLPSFFQALSDPTRLGILNLLSEGELCVCHLTTALRQVQPKISRHLALLKKAGLVKARREGKWMHYAWAEQTYPAARNIMNGLRDWMAKDKSMRGDRRKLKTTLCK